MTSRPAESNVDAGQLNADRSNADRPNAGGSNATGRIELWATLGPEHTAVTLANAALANPPELPVFTIPWGPINLGQRWLADGDPPPPDALTNALGAIDDYLADAEREWKLEGWALGPPQTVASVAITGYRAVSMARLESGVARPPSDLTISRADLEEIFRIAATEPLAELAQNPGLARDDTEAMVAGLCIVAAIARRYRVPTVRFVETASSRRN